MAAQLFEASRNWINGKKDDGTIEVSYAFPAGGGATIANADSHEDLMADIRDFPLFPFISWDVRPLVDIDTSFNSAIEMFKKMAQARG